MESSSNLEQACDPPPYADSTLSGLGDLAQQLEKGRFPRPVSPDDAHYLTVSRAATGLWGLFACIVATFAANLGSLIEVVNRFGSFFYGSILGVFLLAMIPRAKGVGAFVGLIAGMAAVAAVNFGAPAVSFLWHNVIGAVTVLIVGTLLSLGPGRATATPSSG